jgi:hypothetical protein
MAERRSTAAEAAGEAAASLTAAALPAAAQRIGLERRAAEEYI